MANTIDIDVGDSLLVGPQGEQGPQGPQGPQGSQGESAYEVAVKHGYTGSEEEWLASLKVGIKDDDVSIDSTWSSKKIEASEKVLNGNFTKVENVSGMTDTTRVYVNTTDGKWYYYNGTDWVAGGIYQSEQNQEIIDAKQSYLSLKDRLNDADSIFFKTIESMINKPVDSFYNGGISSDTGAYVSVTTRAYWGEKKYLKPNTLLFISDKNYSFKAFEYDKETNDYLGVLTPDWVNNYIFNTENKIQIMIKHKDDIVLDSMKYIKSIVNIIFLNEVDIIDNINEINNMSYLNKGVSDTAIIDSNKRLLSRKYNISRKNLKIVADSDYLFKVYQVYETNFIKTQLTSDWVSEYTFEENTIFKINVKRKDEADISTTEKPVYVYEGLTKETDINNFSVIHEFTPFDVDYSCNPNTPRVLNISSDEFLNTFYNRYLGINSNGIFVGKKALGKDTSNTYDIWQYEFRPKNNKYKKTILLSSGMHTYELPASFGLARWIQEYMTSEEDVFKWLRENIRILVIPIVNPWGFNQNPKKYPNVNGVNPNRNFDDWNNVWESFPNYSPNPSDPNYNEWNYKGTAPFSEKETQILRDWLYTNNNAEFWIDCHTGLGCYNGEIWLLYCSDNPNRQKIKNGNTALRARFLDVYGQEARTYFQIDAVTSIKHEFSTHVVGIPSMTIEQSQGDMIYGTNVNNEPIKITEYATLIHAYITSQLQD